jgi:hypothetical protein
VLSLRGIVVRFALLRLLQLLFKIKDDFVVIIFFCILQPRYHHVKEIKLEFAQDIEDKHLELLKIKVTHVAVV